MPVVPIATLAVTAGAAIYGAVSGKRSNDAAARTATAVAGYNAKLDRSESQQLELDSAENVRAMRKDAAVYMSRQTNAYVASGIRADTGSPLAVRAATAGRFAQREQQAQNDLVAKQQMLESKAQAGIAEGAAQSDQFHMAGIASVIGGAARLAGSINTAYQQGVFGGGGSNTSAGLDYTGD